MNKTRAIGPKIERPKEDNSYESVNESLRAGLIDEAEKKIRRILAKWPHHVRALNDLGVLYARRGKAAEAADRFLVAAQNDGTNRTVIHNLLGALLRLGRQDDAIATLKSIMEATTGIGLVDIAELYVAVLKKEKTIPEPLFSFSTLASLPAPQSTPGDGAAIIGRVACLGKDILSLIRFSEQGGIQFCNQQKGRVDLFLDILRGGQKPKAALIEPFMERKDVYPLIAEQELLPWFNVRGTVRLLVMDSYAELTDRKFTHRKEGWSFCTHYSDLIRSSEFDALFEHEGHIPLEALFKAYWDFFTWFENRYPQAHVAFIQFPTKLDTRDEYKERGQAIRSVITDIARVKPYILNIDLDESVVDWNEHDRYPYHFSKSTNKALADRWFWLEDNRMHGLQEKTARTACVVQGDIRRGTAEVLKHVVRYFDVVILSTWKSDKEKVPAGHFQLILNDKPAHFGVSNRNLQRKCTASGIVLAESLGCTHVMKLRTDMLPVLLDVKELLSLAHFNVPDGLTSRIVTCAFRNITIDEDWFSSIPDLFAFGSIESMKLLWGDDGFDYAVESNVPEQMLADHGAEWRSKPNNGDNTYYAESELYAIFKDRLQRLLNRRLDHFTIAKECLYLIDHERLGICWFHAQQGFRSIVQALMHPWWSPGIWRTGRPVITQKEYPQTPQSYKAGVEKTQQEAWFNVMHQEQWYKAFTALMKNYTSIPKISTVPQESTDQLSKDLQMTSDCHGSLF